MSFVIAVILYPFVKQLFFLIHPLTINVNRIIWDKVYILKG